MPTGTGPGLFWAGVRFRVPVTVPPFQRDEIRFGEPGYDSGDQKDNDRFFFFIQSLNYVAQVGLEFTVQSRLVSNSPPVPAPQKKKSPLAKKPQNLL